MGSGQGFLNSVWIYVSRLLTHPVVRRKSAVFTRGPMLLEQSCTDECSNEWMLTVITSMVDGGGGGVCVGVGGRRFFLSTHLQTPT